VTISPAAAVAAPGSRNPLRRLRDFGRPPRLMGVDIARGLAVLGMAGAHVGATEVFEWARIETWLDLVHGRSSILFAVVAGISIALLTGRRRRPEPEELPALRLRLLGRGAVIFAIGLALELLNTGIAVILTVYGVLFVAVIPFLRWRRRWLALAAALLALLGPVLLEGVRILSLDASGPGLDLVLFGTYPITVWLVFLLAGLALGRSRLDRKRTAATMLAGGVLLAGIGYGGAALLAPIGEAAWSSAVTEPADAGAAFFGQPAESVDLDGKRCDAVGNGYVTCYPEDGALDEGSSSVEPPSYLDRLPVGEAAARLIGAVLSAEAHSGGTLEILGSGGFAVAVIGLSLLAARPLRWPLLPLAALGSMPLSAYSAHAVVIVVAGSASEVADNAFWAWLSLGLLAGATVWVAFLGRGPLERLTAASARAMAGRSSPARAE